MRQAPAHGPNARDVLAHITDADLSNAGLPFGHAREIAVAGATVGALRVTYVGELGCELHVPVTATGAVVDAPMAAGARRRRSVESRALESLRLEKGYRAALRSVRRPGEVLTIGRLSGVGPSGPSAPPDRAIRSRPMRRPFIAPSRPCQR